MGAGCCSSAGQSGIMPFPIGMPMGSWHDARSDSLKVFLEIWGEGDSWEDMCGSVSAYPAHLKAPYAAEDQVGIRATAGP